MVNAQGPSTGLSSLPQNSPLIEERLQKEDEMVRNHRPILPPSPGVSFLSHSGDSHGAVYSLGCCLFPVSSLLSFVLSTAPHPIIYLQFVSLLVASVTCPFTSVSSVPLLPFWPPTSCLFLYFQPFLLSCLLPRVLSNLLFQCLLQRSQVRCLPVTGIHTVYRGYFLC